MAGKRNLFATKEELESAYNEHKSTYKLAELFGVNPKTVSSLMKYYEIQTIGSQGARKVQMNHDYFETIDTPEKAYWLGFLMADGCVYKGTDQYSLRLQVNLKGADIDQLHKLQKAIDSKYKIQVKQVGKSEVCILKVNSTKLCKDLIKHGVTERKSIVCKYPDIPSELNVHFIRGYVDGDGSFKKSKSGFTFCIVGGEEMLLSVQELLPCKTAIYNVKHSDVKSLETGKKESVQLIHKWLYESSTEDTRLNRKYQLCPL